MARPAVLRRGDAAAARRRLAALGRARLTVEVRGDGPALVLLHGFTDSPRTWSLVLPLLERRFRVFLPALAGHDGGARLSARPTAATLADDVERLWDEHGLEAMHVVGNSLGGYVALQLAERGRARSVVAFAPAGGWATTADREETLALVESAQALVRSAAPYADRIASTDAGRRRATRFLAESFEHIPSSLVADQIRGAAACEAEPLLAVARHDGYPLEPERIECPIRIVWGAEDRVLPWPRAAERWRRDLAHADWVVLDGVGHCPQLDVPAVAADLVAGFAA